MLSNKALSKMPWKRTLPPHVIEVKLEEQPPSEPIDGDGEEEISQDEEEEDEDEDEDDEDEDEDDEEEDEEENNEVEDEEEEDFSSKESIRKLLEPFGKEQLMEIFKEAVVKNPSLLSRIMNEAETDPVNRNIFVHDLDWNATSEALAAAFSPFGQIEDCRVIKNQRTGRCKGHGYVLFRTRAAAKRALKDPLKIIGGRATKCRLASFAPYAAAVQARAPATVAGKNFRVGLLNPAAGLSPALSGRVAAVSHQPYTVGDAGIPPQSYAGRPVGSARGSVVSVNSISPSVIGNYGSLAALHGLGAYQNSAPSAAIRPQTGVGSWGASGLGPFYGQ
ncbi:UBP1-associated protein 2A-like [Dendrobium catenatum]|uniref:UBP1-associated protein 2A-like n=1 Tax=Dendrobium catenatum TaxID=906689 RepID=UPI00109FB995|nr:UBP1-associated protein 2A-like [Dendrobium catenatum]XP_020700385.2 UBP1-associated protein 2A-like [Dendrobium catenatum]XP_028550992.1 UBP1-associated protein 2A-like [Dendrobium catenatum]XP_028550993.1 UBP1-associated protein 2A-like [Dendrobium catenatum]